MRIESWAGLVGMDTRTGVACLECRVAGRRDVRLDLEAGRRLVLAAARRTAGMVKLSEVEEALRLWIPWCWFCACLAVAGQPLMGDRACTVCVGARSHLVEDRRIEMASLGVLLL